MRMKMSQINSMKPLLSWYKDQINIPQKTSITDEYR